MENHGRSYAEHPFPAYSRKVDHAYRANPQRASPWLCPGRAAARLGIPIEEFEVIVKDGRIIYLAFGKRMDKFRFNPTDLDTYAASDFLRRPAPRLKPGLGRPIAAVDGLEVPYDRLLREQRDAVDPQWMEWESSPVGWIYFFETPQVRRIKIGYTEQHPDSRRSSLRTGCPVDLVPIGIVRGEARVESIIQRCFPAQQWRSEWFNDHRRIRKFIEAFAVPPSEADDLRDLRMHSEDAAVLFRETVGAIKLWAAKNRRRSRLTTSP